MAAARGLFLSHRGLRRSPGCGVAGRPVGNGTSRPGSINRMGSRLALGMVVGLIALAMAASAAYGSSGQITRAETISTWTLGSFAGSITWTDCPTACSWTPIATVQPALPSYYCQGDEGLDSDPNTRVIWSGGGHTGNGTASLDISNVGILSGVQGQRVCLSALATNHIQDPVC